VTVTWPGTELHRLDAAGVLSLSGAAEELARQNEKRDKVMRRDGG